MKSDLINLIFINSYLALQAKNLQKRPSDTSHIDHHKLYLQDRKNDVGIHLSKYIPVHYDPYFSTFQYRILNFPVQNFSSTEKGLFQYIFQYIFHLSTSKYIPVHSNTGGHPVYILNWNFPRPDIFREYSWIYLLEYNLKYILQYIFWTNSFA